MENLLMEDIELYVENHTTAEDDVLRQLRRKTNLTTTMPRQLSGPVQGKLLEMFSRMINPEYILEIGTFTGYSAYCLAKGLKQGGKLHTIEVKDELEEPLLTFFSKAGISDKVQLHIGDGAEIVKNLDIKFDMAFIDGDKRTYKETYEMALAVVRKGGFIIADNTLWDGHVVDQRYDRDPQTQGIETFNDYILKDPRVEQVILPLRDGLTLIRKV